MDSPQIRRVTVIDSHTGGEPTRVVIDGGPDLGTGHLSDRRDIFREKFDTFRSAVVGEPRGSDAVVGALLCAPYDRSCAAGVIFFNNVGCINMCVHGTIGLVVTLAHLKRISAGQHRIETPVGIVTATLHETGGEKPGFSENTGFPNEVTVANVVSYRYRAGVEVDVEGYGNLTGDIAWGGNWFFLVDNHGQALELSNVEKLTDCTWSIRQALVRDGITGENGMEIDHIELFGPSPNDDCDSRNFVLCPGKAYDRSPCGTGTSAKVACLYDDGQLAEGQIWRQESIVGSVFEGSVRIVDGAIIPHVTGSAFVNSEATLILDCRDPLQMGIRGSNRARLT
jgi:4-hydroxyproline epimerase